MSSAQPLRVFVVEDSPQIRERIEAMLASIDGVLSVGHAVGAEEAIAAILAERPDVVVLDLKLAQGSGFDVLRALQREAPWIGAYMLTNHAIAPYRALALRLGARGFFDKSREFAKARDALARLAAGRFH